MDIPAFAAMTYTVLEDTPLEDYIPTLIIPERAVLQALSGIPEEEEDRLREISLDWAEKTAQPNEEFLVAFRDGPGYFRIIRRMSDGKLQEALYPKIKYT